MKAVGLADNEAKGDGCLKQKPRRRLPNTQTPLSIPRAPIEIQYVSINNFKNYRQSSIVLFSISGRPYVPKLSNSQSIQNLIIDTYVGNVSSSSPVILQGCGK